MPRNSCLGNSVSHTSQDPDPGNYQDPIPRPAAQSTAPVTGSQIPSHITQNVDPSLYLKLQAAVNTAHQQQTRGSSNTPYMPTHLAYSTGTLTPQYTHQQPPTHPAQQYPHQQAYHGGGGLYGGNQYGRNHPSYGGGGGGGQFGYPQQQQGGWGGGPPPGWTPSQAVMMRTPAQTPGRTPAYTPTQTPRSMTSS